MKKQQITALFCSMALMMGNVYAYAAPQDITITVNGDNIVFDGQKPVIQNDITWIPLRGVLETLGVDVAWNKDTKTITLVEGDKVGILTMDNDVFQAGNKEVSIDAPVQNMNGSAMIPLRTVSEYFGADVQWNGETRTIFITKQPQVKYVTDKTYKKEVKNDNGEVVVLATAVYPVLTLEVPDAKRNEINKMIEKKAKEAVDTYIAQTNTDKTDADGKPITYQMVISYEDMYYGNGKLSYLMTAKEFYNNSNHTNMGFGMTFDLTTGKQMRLSELTAVAAGKSEQKYIAAQLQDDVRKHPTAYMVDAITTLDNPETKLGYYLKDDTTLTLFAEAGSIKEAKEGIVKVDIKK